MGGAQAVRMKSRDAYWVCVIAALHQMGHNVARSVSL